MTKAFLQTVPCKISTLSPVHIGCGEDYYPTNYVIDGGFLHHFGENALIEALSLGEKKELAQLAENPKGLKKLQKFVYDKRNSLKNHATHSVPVSEQLEAFYQDRINNHGNNTLDIARHAFNLYSQTPYFPGSSIKGAIRTALLNTLNNGKKLQSVLDELGIKNQHGGRFVANENRDIPKDQKVGHKLQEKLLNYHNIPDDPLRLLKVGDANYQDELFGTEIQFSVNRKNWRSDYTSTAAENDIYKRLECLPAFRHHSFKFDITFLQGEYQCNIELIAKVCNAFFKPQLRQELTLLRNLKYSNDTWLDGLEVLLDTELNEALESNQAFLLRIGQHGGAESNTLNGVRHIKIMQGKDEETKEKRPDKYLSKPTTIWLAGNEKDKNENLLFFGWVLVEIGDTDLKQTAQFLKTQAAGDYQKQQQLQDLTKQRTEFLAEKQKQRVKLLEQENLKRQAYEKQEKERIEKERLAKEKREQQQREYAEKERLQAEIQAQKAAQLATMTDTQKLIFELQEEFKKSTPQNQPISGTLNPKLTALINQATMWPAEDKLALFNLGTEINKTLWGINKKVKDRLKALQ